MLVQKVEPDFIFTNENGCLIQLVHEGWKQVNILNSNKGSLRGGHYHKICREVFYVIKGKLKLTLEEGQEIEENIFTEGEMFLISPFQKHTFEFLEDTLMIAMYDKGVEMIDGSKDIYTE